MEGVRSQTNAKGKAAGQLKREVSEEVSPSDTLILNFQPLGYGKVVLSCLFCPSCSTLLVTKPFEDKWSSGVSLYSASHASTLVGMLSLQSPHNPPVQGCVTKLPSFYLPTKSSAAQESVSLVCPEATLLSVSATALGLMTQSLMTHWVTWTGNCEAVKLYFLHVSHRQPIITFLCCNFIFCPQPSSSSSFLCFHFGWLLVHLFPRVVYSEFLIGPPASDLTHCCA